MNLAQWLARIETIHPKSVDMGLERIQAVAADLGIQKPGNQVILVAGTNGKGSTVAFLDAIGRANGWGVGTYTSPHLQFFNERIRIDGEPVSDELIIRAFERIDAARGATVLTYFEFATLAALLIFADASLDLVILEVGLGGRLDATNIVEPDVAVITTVDLDHQDYLGSDRESIGAEKAGIMRAWKPVVLGDRDPPSSVLGRAYLIGASAIRFNCDFFVDASDNEGEFVWREPGTQLSIPNPRLAAPIQIRNAATAIAAMRALPDAPRDEALIAGVAKAALPGRLQHFKVDGRDVYLDVAHNPQAAASLLEWIAANPIEGRTFAVYAGLADKDRKAVVETLDSGVDGWFLAGLEPPRGDSVDALKQALGSEFTSKFVDSAETVAHAFDHALATSQAGDRVLVFGSFFTVTAALTWLAQRGSVNSTSRSGSAHAEGV